MSTHVEESTIVTIGFPLELETGSISTSLYSWPCTCGQIHFCTIINGDPRWGELEEKKEGIVFQRMAFTFSKDSITAYLVRELGNIVAAAFGRLDADNSRAWWGFSGITVELLCRIDPSLESLYPPVLEP